ncbi:Bardet-Biedl syndrome 2 protein homolog isoform X2 [Halichondria panicea]|uniref:Bardet-Biedl syndrome 2 protein homolog isoform X2 n=1 Tax=Halichondria panicea TaxID=6063 RepID=UPI00312B82AE
MKKAEGEQLRPLYLQSSPSTKMLVPIFTLKLNQKIFPRLVTVGHYDGKHPSLTAATNGGKVFIHTPHHRMSSPSPSTISTARLSVSSSDSDITLLSIGQHVTSLAAGKLDPELDQDVLVVGTQTNVLAYDVEQNSELFYKELPDGANTILIGQLADMSKPLAFVGGNCAITGLDHEGQDSFWTVTGDNVCSLALADFNSDGRNELLVGSEDYDIRVFQGDELYAEINEAEAVVALCPLQGDKFSYALANGIVGVYSGQERFWRIKSKHQPICMAGFDMNEDGVPEVITGWSSGKVDVRSSQTGNVIYKDTFSSTVAGIVQADYRLDGKEELICCSVEGEVRGYLPASMGMVSQQHSLSLGPESKALQELTKRRQNLTIELKNFEINEKIP